MKYLDGIGERCGVDHPKRAAWLPDIIYMPHPRAAGCGL